jgi:hypothetical protein
MFESLRAIWSAAGRDNISAPSNPVSTKAGTLILSSQILAENSQRDWRQVLPPLFPGNPYQHETV